MSKVEAQEVKEGRVVGWKVDFEPERMFRLDYAAFAINLRVLLEKK